MEKNLNFGNCLCYVQGTINGVKIEEADFGSHYDHDSDNAEPYCCADMRFERVESTPAVLEKYGSTQEEYHEICNDLDEGLHFGNCGWCE